MRPAKRRVDPGVAQQLFEEPHRFEYFQAMRIIEQVFHRQGMTAADEIPKRVRYRSSLSLGFPAAEIEAIEGWSKEGEPLERAAAVAHAVATESVGGVRVTPAFMGLLGVSGALPLHYSEMLNEREVYGRDRAARAFLDIFTSRMLAQHYAAWKKYRLALQYELDRRERFLPLVLSLSGLGLPGLRDRMTDGHGDVFDQAIAYYAGGLRQRPVSAAFLQQMLSDYFDTKVMVEQFVGAWYEVPGEQTSRLGVVNARLGTDALAGNRVWQRDLRLQLMVGPLTRERFDAFLPGGDAAHALKKWLVLLTGSCLEYEVRLVLKAEDVRGAGFGEGQQARLGWDSYLCTRPSGIARSDAGYGIHTLQ